MDKLKLLNSSSLNFNLREPNKNKSTNIYAVIKINKKQIKIATELKINSWQWDKKKQMPIIDNRTNKEDIENLINTFNILYDFRFAFLNYFLYICTNDLKPTEDNVKEYMLNNLKKNIMNKENLKKGDGRKPKATNLLKRAFQIYYKEMHTTIKESSIEANETRLKAFLDYCEEKEKDALSMLSQIGINEYQDYLIKKSKREKEKGNKRYDSSKSINNKCELIERLVNKVMVGNSAFIRYNISPIKYNQLEEVIQKGEEKKRRPLKEEEINKLINCQDLNGEEKEYRDLFLLECYGSYRISDTPKLFDKEEQKNINIGEYEFIVINTQKENIISVIWVNDIIREILERYKNGFKHANPLSKSFATRYNIVIKKIAKKAKLDSIETYINAHNEKEERYLYEIIASHFARYTFIYNGLFKFGFTPNELKDFTGHRDDRMINECYKIETAEDKANNAYKAINRVLNEKLEKKRSYRITKENINEQDDLIKEAKEALYCLGADYNDLVDINDYHKLNEMIYVDYHNKYQELGCNMAYIKDLYLRKDIASLKEKRELILKVIKEVKRKK
jgi:hypothetical protein